MIAAISTGTYVVTIIAVVFVVFYLSRRRD